MMQIFSTIARVTCRTLDFLNLLEDDRPRLSLTKIGLWGATLTNLANGIAQVGDQIRSVLTDTPGHLSLPLLAATSITHAIAAAKAELKRRTPSVDRVTRAPATASRRQAGGRGSDFA